MGISAICLALLLQDRPTLHKDPQRSGFAPEEALKKFRTAEDVEVRLFAAEPQLFNPACFDVDERGRVWVAEGVNYRRWAGPKSPDRPFFRQPHRPSGDRIVILEDKDGDGRCDSSTVFYEGLDLQGPMGFAVIGNKVWIAQAANRRGWHWQTFWRLHASHDAHIARTLDGMNTKLNMTMQRLEKIDRATAHL